MVVFLVLNACGRSQKVIERGFYAPVNRGRGARVRQGMACLYRIFIFNEGPAERYRHFSEAPELGCFSMEGLGGSTNLAEVFADQC